MKTRKLSTEIEGIDQISIALTAALYEPETSQGGCVFFCLPGGGVSTELFDLGTYEDFDYSFVSRMTELGHTLIAMDHPGTGTNPLPPDHPFLKPRQAADYEYAALEQFLEQADFTDRPLFGVGHSMGGMMTILTQGRRAPFDAICLFGSSAGGLDWGLDDHEKTYIGREDAIGHDIEELVIRKFKMPFTPPMGGPSGSITFGGANEALNQRLRDIGTELYAAGGMMGMIRGSMTTEVEAITCPIFFAFGDHDIGIPPKDAPKDFINAESTELVVLENTGHNSFAFPSIETLCDRLNYWASNLA
ncbi:MAG: alpha/beta hydrolase [Acidimicrobiales bacterium]|nr:alpha/beta hydrolase [Hyphomonadaceae bacterium]RZV40697.1 MAG: alpha/beta hydrolase [Acidimicrobiales bacterium]